jgi:hypothetical protein
VASNSNNKKDATFYVGIFNEANMASCEIIRAESFRHEEYNIKVDLRKTA